MARRRSNAPLHARPGWIRSVSSLAIADLRRRYAGSVLGGSWSLVGPLLEVGVYAVVFAFLVPGAAGAGGTSYAVFVASGLLPWAAFREAVEGATSTLSENRWIRRSRVPVELLIGRHVLVTAVRAAVGLLIVVAAALSSRDLGPVLLALPVALLGFGLQLVLSYGLGIALAPLGVLYPDLRPGLGSALTLLTFASPILFPESSLGPAARTLVEWNPFTYLLRLYRLPLGLPGATLHATDVLWPAALAVVLCATGALVKSRFFWRARDVL
jgi:ABC-type polysaccharide/polyol phosphate export permease